MYHILKRFQIPKKVYFSLYYFLFPIRHWFLNEGVHIYVHKHKSSFFPWPLSHIVQVDYHSHVSGHHVTGLGFGDYPGFGNVNDTIAVLTYRYYLFMLLIYDYI
jgi:hypothetical protein